MKKNRKAYSVMVALLMIGFLLIMVVGVFNLVLKELNDNRGMGNYFKAFYGAEAGQELALLKIKEKGYGYSDKIELSINDRSVVLAEDSLDMNNFKGNKDVLISYDLSTKSNDYTGELSNLNYDIIPLFYLTGESSEIKVKDLKLEILSGNSNDLVWNIVGKSSGISGIGDFNSNSIIDEKRNTNNGFVKDNIKIKDFLNISLTNYLILVNSGNSNIKYNLKAQISGEFFSKPRTKIFSSAKIGKYRQNLSTDFDNTEFLNILKYSIYSN